MKLKFNKERIIPNLLEYIKIIAIALFYIYVLKNIIFNLFPVLTTLQSPFSDIIFIVIIVYIEELITIIWNGNHIYGRNKL